MMQIKFKASVKGDGFKLNSRCFFKKKSLKQCLSDNSEEDIYPGCKLISGSSIRAHPDAVYTVVDIQQVMMKCPTRINAASTVLQVDSGTKRKHNRTDCVLTLGRASKIRYLPSDKSLLSEKTADLQQWYVQHARISDSGPCGINISFVTLLRFKSLNYDDETCNELAEHMRNLWVKGAKVMKIAQDGVRPFVKHIMRMLQSGIVNTLDQDKLLTGPVLFGELKKCFMCKLQSEHSTSFMVMASSQNPMQAGIKSSASLKSDDKSYQVCFWVIKQGEGKFEHSPEIVSKLKKGMAVMFEELHDGLPENIERGRPYIISKTSKFSFALEPEHDTLELKQTRENILKYALMYHKEAEKASVDWCSIRADRLKSDANHFAKIFCRSARNIDVFETEMNGELLFNMMEYCRAFHHESYDVVYRECSFSKQQYWHQPFGADRVFISEPACNLDIVPFNLNPVVQKPWELQSLASDCRNTRNNLFHGVQRLVNSDFELMCVLYCKILREVQKVSAILSNCGKVSEDLRQVIDVAENAIDDIDKCFMCEDPISSLDRECAKSLWDQFQAEKRRADEEKERADAETRRADKEKERADAEKWRADSITQFSNIVDMPRSFWSLTQTGSFLHAFLSEGKKPFENHKSEKTLLETMYSEATKLPGLGPHCDGYPWPQNIRIELQVPDENNAPKCLTTLTGLRLFSDDLLNGHVSCVDALTKSMMYVPVFAPKTLHQMGYQDCSLTDMNGFLFQLVVARELHETSKIMTKYHSSSARNLYPCSLLRPIFLLTSSQIDDLQSSLGQEPMVQLQRCAREQLEKMGLKVSEQDCLSPHGLLSYYKDKKFYMVDVERPIHIVTDTVKMFAPSLKEHYAEHTAAIVGSLIKEISAGIQTLYIESLAHNFPLSDELVEFLSDASLSRYVPVLARHSIHSVQSFSTLDAAIGCLASVAKEAARGSRLSLEVESKLLLDAIASAQKSTLAEPINVRFAKYVDRDASVCTAAFSSSGIDIFFSKQFGLFIFAVSGWIFFVIGLIWSISFSSRDDFSCPGTPAIDTRFQSSSWGVGLLMLSLALISASAVGYFRDPKLAKFVFCVSLIVYAFFSVVFEGYIFDKFVYENCPGHTSNYIRDCCFYGNYDENDPLALFQAIESRNVPMHIWNIKRLIVMFFKVSFFVILAICCLILQSFVMVLFLSGFLLFQIITILYYLSIGAPVAQTLSRFFPHASIPLFVLLSFYLAGKRVSSEIAAKEALKLQKIFSKVAAKEVSNLNSIVSHCFELSIYRSSSVQQQNNVTQLFQVNEFINGAFQVNFFAARFL
jgi:hypothetical protein